MSNLKVLKNRFSAYRIRKYYKEIEANKKALDKQNEISHKLTLELLGGCPQADIPDEFEIIINKLEAYDFRDKQGHSLANCTEFNDLIGLTRRKIE